MMFGRGEGGDCSGSRPLRTAGTNDLHVSYYSTKLSKGSARSVSSEFRLLQRPSGARPRAVKARRGCSARFEPRLHASAPAKIRVRSNEGGAGMGMMTERERVNKENWVS